MSAREIRKILDAIPIDLKHKCVFLADIPEPYRTEFAHDNQRAVMAIRFRHGRPEPSAYSWDWRNWIEFRCRAERWEPRVKTGAVKAMDDDAMEAWRKKIERGLKHRRET
jgi:hypothetical protein